MTQNKNLPVIYVDLDGTLLGDKGSILHDSKGNRTNVSIDALDRAHASGTEIVIVTGRDHYRAKAFARTIGIEKYIAELGSVLYTTNEEIIDVGNIANDYLKEQNLDAKEFLTIIDQATDFLLKQNPDLLELHTPYDKYRHASAVLRGGIDIVKNNELLKQNGWPFLEVVANGHGMFRRSMPNVENVLIYHLTPIGVGKDSGIIRDQQLRSLDRQQCFIVGDGMADALCSEVVNTCYIPSNGPLSDKALEQYVKEKSNIVVLEGSHNEGFAQAIDHILENHLS